MSTKLQESSPQEEQPDDSSPPSASADAIHPMQEEDADPTPWFKQEASEVTAHFDVDPEQGLSAQEAERRLDEHGPNELSEGEQIHPWQILVEQFTEPLVVVLIAAAGVSGILWAIEQSEPLPIDSIVIMSIVILNALLGFFQEYRAEQAVAALKQMASPESNVRRDGEIVRIPAKEIVPGDIILLDSGDKVPADARLLSTANLDVEEAALTGESVPVHKNVKPLDKLDVALGDRKNMVYMGSVISYGRGEAVVVGTGMKTQMGSIATLLQGVEDEETPLQKELAEVGQQLGILVLVIVGIVTVTGILEQGSFNNDILISMFLFGVALAVAAIPEGLPAVVTAVLALGVRRMADRNAIVRSLPAVETLGSATVICSDKTGTLTRNQMTVRKVLLGDGQILDVSGEGYDPEGVFEEANGNEVGNEVDNEVNNEGNPENNQLRTLLRGAALNNNARLVKNEEDRWTIEGDPTEGALLVAAAKAGFDPADLRKQLPREGEIPFSSERKRMATIHQIDGHPIAFEKGAPDVVIELCTQVRTADGVEPLTDERRQAILSQNEAFASGALRTLAFASRELADDEAGKEEYTADDVEHDLIFEGLVGMIDPPRSEVKDSVAEAHKAGIRTIMITGDHALTALAIAKELGIAIPDENGEAQAITGQELGQMDDARLKETVAEVNVYARVNPEHKLRIVKALKELGEVVAMTGDGVNDAPALRQADIGVAMGITGTDVSKEASDMVLSDDNFATIVAAISEGRTILDNIKKFIRYLLSSNAGEVFTMFFAIILAGVLGFQGEGGEFFLPLLAVQILWINLVTDGGPALALGVDPAQPGLMDRPPRSLDEPVIDRSMWATIGIVGVVMMVGTLFVLDAYLPGGLVNFFVLEGSQEEMNRHARTVAFTTLMMYQMFNVLNCRSQDRSAFTGLFSNRWLWVAIATSIGLHAVVVYWAPLQSAFDTVALTGLDWIVSTAVAASALVVMEVVKLVGRR